MREITIDAGRGDTLTAWAADQRAGDVVRVGPGEYAGVFVRVPRVKLLSDPANPATILPFGEGHNCIRVDLTESADRDSAGGCVTGFVIRGGHQAGILVNWANGHEVRRNRVFDGGQGGDPRRGGWGIKAGFANDLKILDNEIVRTHGQHGIYVADSSDRPVVRGNRIFHARNSAIQINADRTQGGDGVTSGAVVEDNLAVDCGWGGGPALNFDGIQDSTVRGNEIVRHRGAGINLHKTDGAEVPRDVLIAENVIQSGSTCLNINHGAEDVEVRGNVFAPARAGDVIDQQPVPAVRLEVSGNRETTTPFTPEFLASLPVYDPPAIPPPPPPPTVQPVVLPEFPAEAPPPATAHDGSGYDLGTFGALCQEFDTPTQQGRPKKTSVQPPPNDWWEATIVGRFPPPTSGTLYDWVWESDRTGPVAVYAEGQSFVTCRFADVTVLADKGGATDAEAVRAFRFFTVEAGKKYRVAAGWNGTGQTDVKPSLRVKLLKPGDAAWKAFDPFRCHPLRAGDLPPPVDPTDPGPPPPPGGYVWGPIWDHPDYPKLMKAIHGG